VSTTATPQYVQHHLPNTLTIEVPNTVAELLAAAGEPGTLRLLRKPWFKAERCEAEAPVYFPAGRAKPGAVLHSQPVIYHGPLASCHYGELLLWGDSWRLEWDDGLPTPRLWPKDRLHVYVRVLVTT
jgi:hypothetical protein